MVHGLVTDVDVASSSSRWSGELPQNSTPWETSCGYGALRARAGSVLELVQPVSRVSGFVMTCYQQYVHRCLRAGRFYAGSHFCHCLWLQSIPDCAVHDNTLYIVEIWSAALRTWHQPRAAVGSRALGWSATCIVRERECNSVPLSNLGSERFKRAK